MQAFARQRALVRDLKLLERVVPEVVTWNVPCIHRSTDPEASVGAQHFSSKPAQENGFWQLTKLFSREKLMAERARIQEEMNRGYFKDFADLKKDGGKLGPASQRLLPAGGAVAFPPLTARSTEGQLTRLPLAEPGMVSLICLAFRASGQSMVDSWNQPFITRFSGASSVHTSKVCLVESGFLRLLQSVLLWSIRRSQPHQDTLYFFGDTWHIRKTLTMPNRLSAYVYLVDQQGRVRWRASGNAADEELQYLFRSTEELLKEQQSKLASSTKSSGRQVLEAKSR